MILFDPLINPQKARLPGLHGEAITVCAISLEG